MTAPVPGAPAPGKPDAPWPARRRPPRGGWRCQWAGCEERTYSHDVVTMLVQENKPPEYPAAAVLRAVVHLCPEHGTRAFRLNLGGTETDGERVLWMVGGAP